MKKREVSLDYKAPTVAPQYLLAATTNALCELGTQTVKENKDSQEKGLANHSLNR